MSHLPNTAAVADMIRAAFADGGHTHHLPTSRLRRYVVGGLGGSLMLADAPTHVLASQVMRWLRMTAERVGPTADTLGFWVDPDTSLLHVDLGTTHHTIETALHAGRRRRQFAIWDSDTATAIRVH
jgi:hypothetical protein